MPLHTRTNKNGYEEYYDKNTEKWILTYRSVAETIKSEEQKEAKDRLNKEENLAVNQKAIVVHHNDLDKKNNNPDNLIWVTSREHMRIHGKLGYTTYNKSEKHRKRVRQLWKEGRYDDVKFGGKKNKYNTSEKHKEDIRRSFAEGKHENNIFKVADGYNYSKKHHEVIQKVNKSKKHIDSAKIGATLKSIKYLLLNNFPLEEYYYNYYRLRPAAAFDDIPEIFGSYDTAIEKAWAKEMNLDTYTPSYKYSDYDNNQKQQIGNVIHKLIISDKEFNEDNYNKEKGARTVAYKNITKWFKNYDEAYEYAVNYNHTVTDVKVVEKHNQPVYCCTVEKYHNFLLDAGVFVKNCDADQDGAHIVCLLTTMIYELCPKLIENGNLYYVLTPLFEIKDKTSRKEKVYYAFTEEERDKYIKGKDINKLTVQRAKGLGELDSDTMHLFMSKGTRKLIKITPADAEEMEKAFELFMGNDIAPRKEYIEKHGYEYMDDLDID